MPMSNQTRTGLLAVATVGGLFVLVAIVVAVLVIVPQSRGTAGGSGSGSGGGLFGTSKPRADREGEQWTHRELVEYLGSRGIPLRVTDSHENDPNGPRIDYWVPDGTHTFTVQRCAS
jgi:hypothetical protein